MFNQRGELPILPFGNPIGFVPASRGGVYIEFKLKFKAYPITELGLFVLFNRDIELNCMSLYLLVVMRATKNFPVSRDWLNDAHGNR